MRIGMGYMEVILGSLTESIVFIQNMSATLPGENMSDAVIAFISGYPVDSDHTWLSAGE